MEILKAILDGGIKLEIRPFDETPTTVRRDDLILIHVDDDILG
jgi:hypothetical protein